MRYRELVEGKNTPCVVVDVQPSYTSDLPWVSDMMTFLNNQKGPILALCNAETEQLTEDTLDEIKMYWEENGFENWNNIIWYDKGYGYLREAMGTVDDSIIITVIREMYQQKVTDSRDLFNDDIDELTTFIEAAGGTSDDAETIANGISVEWISIKLLKEHAGYIMGGGRDECLREVELMMSAFNIKHRQIDEFIY